MVKRKEIPTVFIGVLALAGTVRADMMPVTPLDAGYRQLPGACFTAAPQEANPSGLSCWSGVVDLSAFCAAPLPGSDIAVGQVCQTRPVRILSDGQNSFSLCLYALIGLGLCRSAPLVKKLSFGVIPDWYHSGGPAQVGRSYAIAPDCRCATPVYCFVQPDGPARDCQPQYFGGMIASLWRKSQCTPLALTARGPPWSVTKSTSMVCP